MDNVIELSGNQIEFIEAMIENHLTPQQNTLFDSAKRLKYIVTRGYYTDADRTFLNNERKWFLELNDWPRWI